MSRFAFLIVVLMLVPCPIIARKQEKAQILLEKHLARVTNKHNLMANKTFVNELFGTFQIQHPRHNQSAAHQAKRLETFQSAVENIVKHNETTNRTFNVGINKFVDWTYPELDILRGNRSPPPNTRDSFSKLSATQSSTTSTSNKQTSTTLATYDLTTRVSAVNPKTSILRPVKDQGQCGSCYAFAFITLIEAQYAFQFGKAMNMSEQQIVDCSTEDFGCSGGYITLSFAYFQSYKWHVDNEAYYPYQGVVNTCSATKNRAWSAGNFVYRQVTTNNITTDNATAMQQALLTFGPLWISLYVGSDCSGTAASSCPVKPVDAMKIMTTFQSYTDGVFQASGCTPIVDDNNHAMVIVGYGYDSKTKLDYWKVRNSWSEDWGEEGYIRIQRGVNMCNVESDAFIIAKPAS